jgi:hypothetical protein
VLHVSKAPRRTLVAYFSKVLFIFQLVVTYMIFSPSKELLIFLLIVTAQLTMGCRAKYDVKLLNLKEGTEVVFCTAHPNHTGAQSIPGATFFVSVGHDPDLKKNVARIEARAGDGAPIIMVGNQLQEGDIFSFKNVKWKILKIGTDGVTYDGKEYCQGKFIHINRLEPKPKT